MVDACTSAGLLPFYGPYGDIRDTLIDEYEGLEKLKEPVLARMEKIKLIRRAGEDGEGEAVRYAPATSQAGRGRWGGGETPDFMMRLDPWADLEKVRDGLVRGTDMIARSMSVIEMHHKRGLLRTERAEEAARKAMCWMASIVAPCLPINKPRSSPFTVARISSSPSSMSTVAWSPSP